MLPLKEETLAQIRAEDQEHSDWILKTGKRLFASPATRAESDLLHDLLYWWKRNCTKFPDGARPMDIGGGDGTNHSALLNKLVERGFVMRTARSSSGRRGSYRYRPIADGEITQVLACRIRRDEEAEIQMDYRHAGLKPGTVDRFERGIKRFKQDLIGK